MRKRLFKIFSLLIFCVFFLLFSAFVIKAQSIRCPIPIYPLNCSGTVLRVYDINGCPDYKCQEIQNPIPKDYGGSWCPEANKQTPTCSGNYEKKNIYDTTRNCLKQIVCEPKTTSNPQPLPDRNSTSTRCPQPVYPFCIGAVTSYYDENGCLKYDCDQSFSLFGTRNWCPGALRQVPSCPGMQKKEVIDPVKKCLQRIECDQKDSQSPLPSKPQCPAPPTQLSCNPGYILKTNTDKNGCIVSYECVQNPTQWTPQCPKPLPAALRYDINKNGIIEANELNIAIKDHTNQNVNPYYNLSSSEYENIRQLYEGKCKFQNNETSSQGKDTSLSSSQICQRYYTSRAREVDANKNGLVDNEEFFKAFKERKNIILRNGQSMAKFSLLELKKLRVMSRLKCQIYK